MRRQLAIRSEKLRKHQKNVDKPVKQGCQTEYRAVGAKIMAQERRQASIAATEAATNRYQDPRSLLTSAELRNCYRDTTGQC